MEQLTVPRRVPSYDEIRLQWRISTFSIMPLILTAEMDPRKVISSNIRLEDSVRSKAKKSLKITLSRFIAAERRVSVFVSVPNLNPFSSKPLYCPLATSNTIGPPIPQSVSFLMNSLMLPNCPPGPTE